MKVLYHRYHRWPLSNIGALVKICDDNGTIRVFVNEVEKTHVKDEIFRAIGYVPQTERV